MQMRVAEETFYPAHVFDQPFIDALKAKNSSPSGLLKTLVRFRAIESAAAIQQNASTVVWATMNGLSVAPFARYDVRNRLQMGGDLNLSNTLRPMDNLRVKIWTSLAEIRKEETEYGHNLSINYAFPTFFRHNFVKIFHKDVLSWGRNKTHTGVKFSWPVRNYSASLLLENEPTFPSRGHYDFLGIPKVRVRYSSVHSTRGDLGMSAQAVAVAEAPLVRAQSFDGIGDPKGPEFFINCRTRLRVKTESSIGRADMELMTMLALSNRYRDQSHQFRGQSTLTPLQGNYKTSCSHQGFDFKLSWSLGQLMRQARFSLFTFVSGYFVGIQEDPSTGPTRQGSLAWGVGIQKKVRRDFRVEALFNARDDIFYLRASKM